MPEEFLPNVYDLETQDETDAYYTAWAATYDDELTRNGYRTPGRAAEALARFVSLDTPVLDIGCGTGLSGVAFAEVGFTEISGQDVNAEMLEQAEAAGVYRVLRLTDLGDPFPFPPGTYGAIAAIGVIGRGAAPASVLGDALDALGPGGYMVFSYNDYALESPEYMEALADAVDSGIAVEVLRERGPHIERLESESTVFVLRRT